MPRAFEVCATLLALCAPGWSQTYGTTPRPKPGDYPVQVRVGDTAISAEYLVHTLPGRDMSYVLPSYLVIEVAAYPPKSPPLVVWSGDFRLRINRKTELGADTPAMVAASLKHPEWEAHKGLDVQGGVGPVIFGRTDPAPRFPGDTTGSQGPVPPRAPVESPASVERPAPQSVAEAAVEFAYPDGPCHRPVSGYLYFPFAKKAKSIQSLELIWLHGRDETVIKLF